MPPLTTIPGIGRTFAKDFARIGITDTAQLRHQSPEDLFHALERANHAQQHLTSRNYLYVIRMAVYYANGGRDPEKLRWNAWADRSSTKPSPTKHSSMPRPRPPMR